MKYILNETQIVKVLKNLSEESHILKEGLEDSGEGVYSVKSVSFSPKKKESNYSASYFFNDLKFIRKHNENEESIKIYGDENNEFFSPIITLIFNGINYNIPLFDSQKKDIIKSFKRDGKLNAVISEVNLKKLYPNFKIEKPAEYGITSALIRKVLEKSFPENWNEEDRIFSAGVRGIYTIGEKLGTNESWSIMNFFDTKEEIHNLIMDKFVEEHPNENKISVEWLVDKFRNDKSFLEELVTRQWKSIGKGFESEQSATKSFKEKVGGNGTIITYPPGAKMDRYNGVDVTFNGHHLQVKPLSDYNKNTNQVTTYGMLNYMGKLPEFIVFVNDKHLLIFSNNNYIVNSKTSVTFKEPPLPFSVLK